MRITSKGQVTIPVEIRRRFGFLPETEVEFRVEGATVRLVKVRGRNPTRGESLVANLRGSADIKMTTDEILALTRE